MTSFPNHLNYSYLEKAILCKLYKLSNMINFCRRAANVFENIQIKLNYNPFFENHDFSLKFKNWIRKKILYSRD